MSRRRYELTDYEWSMIQPLLPNKSRGVPRVDDRRVINGILWRFRTGSPWADIPERYGPPTTCYNRFVRWREAGVWDRLLQEIAQAYNSKEIRRLVEERGVWANIPARKNRKHARAFSGFLNCYRNLVERFFGKIKQVRGIAMRDDKKSEIYTAALKLASLRICLKSYESAV